MNTNSFIALIDTFSSIEEIGWDRDQDEKGDGMENDSDDVPR